MLDDATALCAFARFCDRQGHVWHLVLESDQRAAAQAGETAVEPDREPSIGLVRPRSASDAMSDGRLRKAVNGLPA